ncbi:hypothetical protein DER46DRAFT_401872 [Fusarium sp. MPI-SDFR-AT-0072]|nr:hypothetical protein DER46DRAFT_401872 [Fusarium sp. MPI-SDFR-AT-0072]
MQDDGKLAVYHGDYCAWQGTDQQDWNPQGVKMQEDGNLVIYDNSGTGHATWHTNTSVGKGNDSRISLFRMMVTLCSSMRAKFPSGRQLATNRYNMRQTETFASGLLRAVFLRN